MRRPARLWRGPGQTLRANCSRRTPPARTPPGPSARRRRSRRRGWPWPRPTSHLPQQELKRVQAERDALVRQRANLRLVAPVDALVVSRDAEPGSTLVAGQPVVEVIDPASLWIDVRFDQLNAAGLRPGMQAQVALRSRPNEALAGQVLRVEPLADSVTEELLAKVAFATLPDPLPAVGELAEVTVALAALPPAPVVPRRRPAPGRWSTSGFGCWGMTACALRRSGLGHRTWTARSKSSPG